MGVREEAELSRGYQQREVNDKCGSCASGGQYPQMYREAQLDPEYTCCDSLRRQQAGRLR
jgi:hypothetical protein